MPSFNKKYFLAAICLFLIEIGIALFVRDRIIRPYGGDFLVVVFLYCLLKSFWNIPVKNAIFGVLFFAYTVEALQYFDILGMLGLSGNKIASVVLGNHFEWLDMLLYTIGALAIFSIEQIKAELSQNHQDLRNPK